MKVFISGVAGFLGSHLADEFLNDGHEVVGCDNLIGGYLDNVPKDVEFHQNDLNHYDYMVKITKKCDVVYHCAATAYEGLSVFSPNLVTKNIDKKDLKWKFDGHMNIKGNKIYANFICKNLKSCK